MSGCPTSILCSLFVWYVSMRVTRAYPFVSVGVCVRCAIVPLSFYIFGLLLLLLSLWVACGVGYEVWVATLGSPLQVVTQTHTHNEATIDTMITYNNLSIFRVFFLILRMKFRCFHLLFYRRFFSASCCCHWPEVLWRRKLLLLISVWLWMLCRMSCTPFANVYMSVAVVAFALYVIGNASIVAINWNECGIYEFKSSSVFLFFFFPIFGGSHVFVCAVTCLLSYTNLRVSSMKSIHPHCSHFCCSACLHVRVRGVMGPWKFILVLVQSLQSRFVSA